MTYQSKLDNPRVNIQFSKLNLINMDVSLDDIIKKNKPSHKKTPDSKKKMSNPRKSGNFKMDRIRLGQNQRGRSTEKRGNRDNLKPTGNKNLQRSPQGPTKMVVSNLHPEVDQSDLQELFSEYGRLKKVVLHFDRNGKSQGSADVIFDRKSDAIKSMKQYNGVPLDGKPMKIELVLPKSDSRPILKSRINERSNFGRKTPLKRRNSGKVVKPRSVKKAKMSPKSAQKKKNLAEKKPKPTAEDLDKEMEEYMKGKPEK